MSEINQATTGSNMRRLIPVTKARKIAFVISAALLLAGIVSLIAHKGFNLGIDFDSGLTETVHIASKSPARIEDVRKSLSSISGVKIQNVGDKDNSTFQVRVPLSNQDEREKAASDILSSLEKRFGKGKVEVTGQAFIGAKFSSDLITTSITAILVALVIILLYIWMRFRLSYAIASVLSLVHDVLLLLSFISLLNIEISSIVIAAILTIIGYCLNNTIVIFDKIRENVQGQKLSSLGDIACLSVTQMMKRTLFSSFTTIAAVFPLALLVTGDIKTFATCLIVGILIGLYSSTFIASNLLILVGKIDNPLFDPMAIKTKESV